MLPPKPQLVIILSEIVSFLSYKNDTAVRSNAHLTSMTVVNVVSTFKEKYEEFNLFSLYDLALFQKAAYRYMQRLEI